MSCPKKPEREKPSVCFEWRKWMNTPTYTFKSKKKGIEYNEPFTAISDCIPVSFDCQIAKLWIQIPNTMENSIKLMYNIPAPSDSQTIII